MCQLAPCPNASRYRRIGNSIILTDRFYGAQPVKLGILVVDDSAIWRNFVLEELRQQANFEIIGEAADGLNAVKMAEEYQPDLILLDLGLPGLNGIEVARRIRDNSRQSKILVVSAEQSFEIAEEAFCAGAHGYVVKSEAKRELLAAVKAVLKGKRFVGASLHDKLRSTFPHLDVAEGF